MGDGRAEGSSAIGDVGQAAISLTPDLDGTHVHIFESSQLEGSYVGDLLYWPAASLVGPNEVFKRMPSHSHRTPKSRRRTPQS